MGGRFTAHPGAMAIADEKYVALTTFRKNGERKSTPVWIADLGDGRLGFTTESTSWKAKRLRNDPRVELQPSDSRGNPRSGSDVVTGTGEVVQGAEFDTVRERIKGKYGIQVTLIRLIGAVGKLIGKGSNSDAAIVITPDA